MRSVTQRVIGVDVGQFLLGRTETFIGVQIQQHAGAFAFGIGEELFCFGGQRFHGKTLSDSKLFVTCSWFFAPASSSSKSTISLICTRNHRSIFVRLKISSMLKPARRAWRMKKILSALGTLSLRLMTSWGRMSRSP